MQISRTTPRAARGWQWAVRAHHVRQGSFLAKVPLFHVIRVTTFLEQKYDSNSYVERNAPTISRTINRLWMAYPHVPLVFPSPPTN